MKYIAETLTTFLSQRIRRLGRGSLQNINEMRVVTESLPAAVVVHVGQSLEEYTKEEALHKRKIRLIYKVAYDLGRDWYSSGCKDSINGFQQVKSRGWYDEENHLTRWRNSKRNPSQEDFLVIVLVGLDRVRDQASLSDFYRLDHQTMWRDVLKQSFRPWLEKKLKESGVNAEKEHMETMDRVLKGLFQTTLTDLYGISSYLEGLSLAGAIDGRDALPILTRNLDYFKLPRMAGLVQLPRRRSGKVFQYFNEAVEFFNYGKFLDPGKRKEALERVNAFSMKGPQENINAEDLGDYESCDDLIKGLQDYIDNNDIKEREKLRTVDFVFLHDKVLGFKPSDSTRKASTVKKLKGDPLPVILRALWITLKDYKQWALEKKLDPTRSLTRIEIRGVLFKHDCEGGTKKERDDNAHQYLCRVLGGLDTFVEKQLSFPPDQDDNERCIEVYSALCPKDDYRIMAFESSRSAEPFLEFKITVKAGEGSIERKFRWSFPKLHPYRTMYTLFEGVMDALKKSRTNPLPVFTVPHFEELMLSKDEEEVNRVLQHAVQGFKIENLLEAPGYDRNTPVFTKMHDLACQYACFMDAAWNQGLFGALQDRYIPLETAFRKAYGEFLTHDNKNDEAGPLLFKAFCLLNKPEHPENKGWMWEPHASALVVTPLHPALLEMLYHQHAFLCEGFVSAARAGLSCADAKALNEKRWLDIESLAQIQWPLHGTLQKTAGILDTKIRSFGLIHLVGETPKTDAVLTTRLLLRYEADDDDELTDEELLAETRESAVIYRILGDYLGLHPHARDGLAIAAYCGVDIQFLIAGLHAFLENLFKDRQDQRPYHLSLTVFSESQNDVAILRWVREWRQRWETAEEEGKFGFYRHCRISVAHRLVSGNQNHAQLVRLLSQIDCDISFLIKFIASGTSHNEFLRTKKFDHRTRYRMFPVLEKVCCPVIGGMHEKHRERIISNRQFKLSTLHTGVMAKLKGRPFDADTEYLVVGGGNFGVWVPAVDKFHERSTWVVCIDPLIDEYLLSKDEKSGSHPREIIGFGSGVGAHGEYNYSVSTEKSSLSIISKRIKSHVAAKFGISNAESLERIAESLVREAVHVAGMSLIKATGPSEYVRDFMAYAMVRKMLPRDPQALCDEIVSLDAYHHWFDAAHSGLRPDLLHVRARVDEKHFHIEACVIECKLAQQSERHLEKAREQVTQGLEHLIQCFLPREGSLPEGLDQRPDQRYWWLQLHRLLASKTRVHNPQLEKVVVALENLSEGFYTIRWGAGIITFWTDVDGRELVYNNPWEFEFRGKKFLIPNMSAGRLFIQALCDGSAKPLDLLTNETSIVIDWRSREDDTDNIHSERSEETPINDATKQEDGVTIDRGHITIQKSTEKEILPARSIPERILLGKGSSASNPIYWEFGHPQLPNRHMLILGTSGMGKTYTIQAILFELARCGINSLIIDYTDGFHDEHLERETLQFLKPRQHIVKQTKVPINPFRQHQDVLGGQIVVENPIDTAQRVAGVFSEVYELGDQQRSALYSAVKRGIELYGQEMSLVHLPKLLKETAENGVALGSSVGSVISKLQPFVDMNPFGGEGSMSWERFFTDTEARCHILQLAGYLKTAARLITEFSLIDFYWHCRTQAERKVAKIVVLDEIQNLDQRLESPLGKFLTEGRKFGICLIAATQTLSYFQKDEKDRLFQAAHKLFFRPAETEIKTYAQILESATQEKADIWIGRLSSLEKGECYSLGYVLRPEMNKLEVKAIKIRIVPLKERISRTT